MSDQQVQPDEGQGQPDPAAPTLSDSPWKAKLESVFTDPAEAARVDQFMREGYQPYVTQLEQEKASLSERTFVFDALEADAEGSFKQMAEELFGEDVAALVAAALDGTENEVSDETSVQEAVAALPPEVQQQLDWVAQQQQEQKQRQAHDEYLTELSELQASEKGKHIDPDLFHPFVFSSDGDLDAALAKYNVFAEKAGLLAKEETPEAPPAPADTPAAPVTIPKGQTLDQALDDFFAENNKIAAPATV